MYSFPSAENERAMTSIYHIPGPPVCDPVAGDCQILALRGRDERKGRQPPPLHLRLRLHQL